MIWFWNINSRTKCLFDAFIWKTMCKIFVPLLLSVCNLKLRKSLRWTEHGNWARLLNKVGKCAFWNRIWPYEHRSPDKCLNYILRGCVFSNLGFWIIIIISTVSRAIWKLENTMDLKWIIMFRLFEIFDNQLWSINQMKYNIHRMVEHWTSFLSFVENCVAFITMRIVNHFHLLTWSSVSCIIHSFTI